MNPLKYPQTRLKVETEYQTPQVHLQAAGVEYDITIQGRPHPSHSTTFWQCLEKIRKLSLQGGGSSGLASMQIKQL
jgi:hypothetical protein